VARSNLFHGRTKLGVVNCVHPSAHWHRSRVACADELGWGLASPPRPRWRCAESSATNTRGPSPILRGNGSRRLQILWRLGGERRARKRLHSAL